MLCRCAASGAGSAFGTPGLCCGSGCVVGRWVRCCPLMGRVHRLLVKHGGNHRHCTYWPCCILEECMGSACRPSTNESQAPLIHMPFRRSCCSSSIRCRGGDTSVQAAQRNGLPAALRTAVCSGTGGKWPWSGCGKWQAASGSHADPAATAAPAAANS